MFADHPGGAIDDLARRARRRDSAALTRRPRMAARSLGRDSRYRCAKLLDSTDDTATRLDLRNHDGHQRLCTGCLGGYETIREACHNRLELRMHPFNHAWMRRGLKRSLRDSVECQCQRRVEQYVVERSECIDQRFVLPRTNDAIDVDRESLRRERSRCGTVGFENRPILVLRLGSGRIDTMSDEAKEVIGLQVNT